MAEKRRTTPLHVLTLSQGWDSSYGGIATFNRELSIALAESGHQVTARVSHDTAPHPLVAISVAPRVPGIDDDRAYLLNPAGLPAHVDAVIGHSRFSGGPAGVIRDTRYPNVPLIHVVHTSPELLGRLQNHPEHADRNADNERALISRATLVVAVGPLLFDEAIRLARQSGEHPPPVHEFIPGVNAHPQPDYSTEPARERFHLLLFGRANEPLKGAGNAADIVRALSERGMDIQLSIRGASPADRVQQERELSQRAGRPVWVKPFTSDPTQLSQDLRGTDLVLVAAIHEDFGLVATEAAGHGVPLLVGDHTGVGMFLSDPQRVPQALAGASVVSDTSNNIKLWADRVQGALQNLGTERQRARELQQHLTTTYTWRGAGDKLMTAIATATTAPRNPINSAQVAAQAFPRKADRPGPRSSPPPTTTPDPRREDRGRTR
jgi:glycosyltransferase involved in cell wall biosynthesis